MAGDEAEPMDVDEQYLLPPKDHSSPYTGGGEDTVLANLFYLSIDPHQTIFKYRIDMLKIIASKNKQSDITKGPNHDPARQVRRRITQSLMNDLLKFAAKEGRPVIEDKNKFIYDCGNLIYSAVRFECFPLVKGEQPKDAVYRISAKSINSENTRKFLGSSCTEVLITIVPVLEFQPTLAGDLNVRRETQQFLELVTSARLVREGDHLFFKNKVYPKTSKKDVVLGEGKSIKPGFEKNVRVGEREGRACALLQIDAKKSPFFIGQPLLNFSLELLNLRRAEDLESLSSSQARQLNAQLKGLVVHTTHNTKDKQRMFVISQISNQRVKDITFEREGESISLVDYFRSQYNAVIKHTRTPVVVERKAQGNSYYPIEFLEIERGQRALEAKYGVITQHVWRATFNKAIGPKGAFMVLNNLMLKLNLKAHGVNHMSDISRQFMDSNRNAGDIAKRVFPKYRMIVGLDVSHTGPQSYADRQAGTPSSEPSVVGMSYSISCPTEMKGTYWLQEARLATITELGPKMLEALKLYHNAMGRYPEDIIVYRGGVSEGEYDKVVKEINDMKLSFAELPGFNPSLMAIIVQTNSNFRVIPEKIDPRAKPMDQNVRPGTCVDMGIVNPQYNEFILVAQKGIMGTVRPIRCMLAVSEQGRTGKPLNFEDVKVLTHALCHGHQVVAGSTTLPCPLTAATNLSKRGRNNWKYVNFRDSDCRSEISAGSGGLFRHDGSDNYFSAISKTVGTKLSHHFWA